MEKECLWVTLKVVNALRKLTHKMNTHMTRRNLINYRIEWGQKGYRRNTQKNLPPYLLKKIDYDKRSY